MTRSINLQLLHFYSTMDLGALRQVTICANCEEMEDCRVVVLVLSEQGELNLTNTATFTVPALVARLSFVYASQQADDVPL